MIMDPGARSMSDYMLFRPLRAWEMFQLWLASRGVAEISYGEVLRLVQEESPSVTIAETTVLGVHG